jgi:hypothetical protein
LNTLDERPQPLALPLVLDARRDADAARVRQHNEKARWNRNVRRQSRAFGPERILEHLHEQLAALLDAVADARLGVAIPVVLVRVARDIRRMQERRALEARLDERRLHPGQHA